jgi:hypothetical protein
LTTAGCKCTGSLALPTAARVKVAGLKVVLQLGRGRYDVGPGAATTLKVKLAKGIQRVADSKRRLKVLAVAATGPSGKTASSTRHLTLVFAPATNPRH